MPTTTRTITIWFTGGHTWSYTCSAQEAQYFVAYASGAELTDGPSTDYVTPHGGIFQPPSAPGRYIVWVNVTDFQIA